MKRVLQLTKEGRSHDAEELVKRVIAEAELDVGPMHMAMTELLNLQMVLYSRSSRFHEAAASAERTLLGFLLFCCLCFSFFGRPFRIWICK